MRQNQLRTTRVATVAVIGTGVVAALGTATVLVIPTLHLGDQQDALNGGTTGQSQSFQQPQQGGDDGERESDDNGGFGAVNPPQQGNLAPPPGQSSGQNSGPSTHSSGS